jgi:hypothetical protein
MMDVVGVGASLTPGLELTWSTSSAPYSSGAYSQVMKMRTFANNPIAVNFLGGNTGGASLTLGGVNGVGMFTVLDNLSIGNGNGLGSVTITGLTTKNLAIGAFALGHMAQGNYNVAIGYSVLTNQTNADFNTAVGANAMTYNLTGHSSAAFGTNALLNNTTGIKNTAIGAGALENTTTGGFNTGVGEDVLLQNTTGVQNVAIGCLAGSATTVSNNNTSLGWSSARSVTTGGKNIFIGSSSGYLDEGGINHQAADVTNCIVIGTEAYSTANYQTILGSNATVETKIRGNVLLTNMTPVDSITPTSILHIVKDGVVATGQTEINGILLQNNTTAAATSTFEVTPPITFSVSSKPAFGSANITRFQLYAQGGGGLSTADGSLKLAANVGAGAYTTLYTIHTSGQIDENLNLLGHRVGAAGTGTANFRAGFEALNFLNNSSVTGGFSTAVGYQAMRNATTGAQNSAFGSGAMLSNTTGADNVAVGINALLTASTASFNTAIGSMALRFNTTGFSNTAVGKNALLNNTTAIKNTAIGAGAMENTTTGGFNTTVGEDSLLHNTTGTNNVAMGWLAWSLAPDGDNNVALGWSSGRTVSIGDNNIFIGTSTGYLDSLGAASQVATVNNSIVIGNFAYSTADNQMVLGNSDITTAFISGAITGTAYGTGANTGTTAYYLAVTSAGLIIEKSSIPATAITDVVVTNTAIDLTLDATHRTVTVDATAANRTITLPAAASCSGRTYVIKKIDVSVNTVTIDGDGSETIDGAATVVISSQYAGKTIQSTGSAWIIIGTF